MTLLLAIVFLPCLACWLWVPRVVALTALERLAASVAFGIGLSSTAYFLARLAGLDTPAVRVADPVIWTALVFVALAMGPATTQAAAPVRTNASARLVLVVLAVILAAVFVPYMADRTQTSQAGDWDAWAIWNLRARFLAASGTEWLNGFDPALATTHPDYPLLVPAAVARAWVVSGTITPAAPALIAFAGTTAAAVAVVGSLLARVGARSAICGLLLLVVPTYVHLATAQQADIFVGLFTLLALVLMATATTPGAVAAAGLALGMAAWSKNEGLTAAGGMTAAFLAVRYWQSGRQDALRMLRGLVAGLGPMLGVLLVFKLTLASANDLTSTVSSTTLAHWTDLPRLQYVVTTMARHMGAWGGWPVLGPLCFVPLVVVALPAVPRRARHAAVHAAFLGLACQFLVFFAVYVMTPHTPAWHIATSWDRLILQLWPATVWWACARSMTRATSPS